ncbi:MAG: InlB B-repeat-containing protein [Kiritimatiellae bacterium]|nr:InlB B-repeat-containing protein [Kiritimatiellia bacterium]
MDVLYIPQLDEAGAGGDGDGEGGVAARYRILKRVPEDGVVTLTDRAVTKVDVAADCESLKLVVPQEAKGTARDFFVRLVITADEIPEVTFAAPTGETISFEDVDEDVFKCETGVNVFAFTETDTGIFVVNRKQIDIDLEVEFDPCGGTLDKTVLTFKLGALYSTLPKPTMAGYSFLGWFTAAEDGVKVEATDRCKTGVTKLYAHWEVYVDPFVDAICAAKNLTFFSESESPWTVDGEGAARSGAIGDNGATSLTTTVQGKGTLAFRWRTSSEWDYDWLHVIIDGSEAGRISGDRSWENFSHTFTTDGSHTVEWRYDKDGSVSDGNDCGWIDDVVWTPEGGA